MVPKMRTQTLRRSSTHAPQGQRTPTLLSMPWHQQVHTWLCRTFEVPSRAVRVHLSCSWLPTIRYRSHSLQELFTIWQVMQHLSPNTRGRAARRTPATTAWPLQVAPQIPTTTAWPARTATPRVESGNADAHACMGHGWGSFSYFSTVLTVCTKLRLHVVSHLDSHLAARLFDTRSPRIAS
jgi:hypothetical protein